MTPQPKCKWQWLKIVIAFVTFSHTFSTQFIKLQGHSTASVRLLDHYKTVDNTPLLSCSLQCRDDLNCVSINYNTAKGTCEMNDKSSLYGVVVLLNEQNWDVYNIAQGRCSKGWFNFLGSCYWIEKEHKVNWTTAHNRCAALNAQLLKIESEGENRFIKTEMSLQISGPDPDKIYVWMAGNDLDEENEWVWAEMSGEVLKLAAGGIIDFTNWAAKSPDNWHGNQHCLTITSKLNYTWDDVECSARFYFICEVQRIWFKVVIITDLGQRQKSA